MKYWQKKTYGGGGVAILYKKGGMIRCILNLGLYTRKIPPCPKLDFPLKSRHIIEYFFEFLPANNKDLSKTHLFLAKNAAKVLDNMAWFYPLFSLITSYYPVFFPLFMPVISVFLRNFYYLFFFFRKTGNNNS